MGTAAGGDKAGQGPPPAVVPWALPTSANLCRSAIYFPTACLAGVLTHAPLQLNLLPRPAAGALFPALFACLVYPATGLNPKPQRFARFLGVLTLEAMSAQVCGYEGHARCGDCADSSLPRMHAQSTDLNPPIRPPPPGPPPPPTPTQALGLAVGAAAPSTEAALAIGPAVILVSHGAVTAAGSKPAVWSG